MYFQHECCRYPANTEPEWPAADVVIGNPPFLGGKLLITHLGEDYVSRMFSTYAGRVPAEADLVCYWFAKAGRQIATGKTARAGLVATNSIRGGANRRALQAATENRRIFEAWSDEQPQQPVAKVADSAWPRRGRTP